MAERRMFAKTIIGSARFLRMPPTSRLLYYDLGMYADDDGVVEAFSVMRTTGATEDDLKVLASKGFLAVLNEDLVSYITDWSRNNLIKKDRYRPSAYHELLVQLQGGTPLEPEWNPAGTHVDISASGAIKPIGTQLEPEWNHGGTNCDTDASVAIKPVGTQLEPNWNQDGTNCDTSTQVAAEPPWNQSGTTPEPGRNPSGTQVEPQVRLGKDRLGKGKREPAKPATHAPGGKVERNAYGQYRWVKLSDEEYSRLSNELGESELKRCIAYVDESAQSTGNKNRWRDWNLVLRRCHRDGWGMSRGKPGAAQRDRDPVRAEDDYSGWDSFV